MKRAVRVSLRQNGRHQRTLPTFFSVAKSVKGHITMEEGKFSADDDNQSSSSDGLTVLVSNVDRNRNNHDYMSQVHAMSDWTPLVCSNAERLEL